MSNNKGITVEKAETWVDPDRTTTTDEKIVKVTEKIEVVTADQLIKDAQFKKREAEEIVVSELKLAESASQSLSELRRKIKVHRDKVAVLETQVNAEIEEERRLERLRVAAHERAVSHEQQRAEAEALMHAAELQLDSVLREEEKHRLASEQARALVGKYELDVQQAILKKRQEEYNFKHKSVFEKHVSELEPPTNIVEEVVVVPREIPEQITVTDTKTTPVHLTVQPTIIPAQTIAEIAEADKRQERREITETTVEGGAVKVKSSIETRATEAAASKTVLEKTVK